MALIDHDKTELELKSKIQQYLSESKTTEDNRGANPSTGGNFITTRSNMYVYSNSRVCLQSSGNRVPTIIYTCTFTYICMYICMYVHMDVCIYLQRLIQGLNGVGGWG